jgi:pilus assembly protein Flp/PilA
MLADGRLSQAHNTPCIRFEVHLNFVHTGVFNMSQFLKSVQTFWADEEGATAIEYGLLASLIAVAIIGATTTLGESIAAIFGEVSAAL